MSREQVLRWMLEFGTGWVSEELLFGTWADDELTWFACVANGWLDETVDDDMGDMLKLTPKALESLNGG